MQIFRYFLFCIAVLLLHCPSVRAEPDGNILSRAYVVDPQATLGIDDVRGRQAQAYDGMLSLGYTTAATWIRITVAPLPMAAPGDMLVVRVRPSYLDEIQLFDPLDHSGRLRVAGDRTSWRDSEFKSLNHGFLIPASDTSRDIWLRLKTTSTSMIHVQVMTVEEAQQANRMQEMVYGLVMGTLVLFFLWSALQWLLRREALMAAFLASQVMAMLYAFTYVGYLRMVGSEFASASVIERFSCYVYCLYTAVGFVFHFFLLREFRPWKAGPWLLLGVGLSAFVAEIIFIVSDQVMPAMRLNITVVAIAPIGYVLVSLSCRAWTEASEDEQPSIPKWMLVGFYALLTMALALASFPALGISRAPEVNLHMFLIHGMMTGVILIVLLQLRSYRIEESRNRAYFRAQSAAQQVEIEKQKARLQGRFMEMLAHELKTSLSVLHMVLGAPKPNSDMLEHGRRTVNNINQLIERCLQAEQFEDDEIISHFEKFSFDELIADVISKIPDSARIRVQDGPEIFVNSDWRIFNSVVSNLVDNALKYSAPNSIIEIRSGMSKLQGREGFEIAVENQVAHTQGYDGFPDVDQLFKKYYRAEGARNHSGSGLGLYLVANFMRLLGGDVNYERFETSVRFTVWLPN